MRSKELPSQYYPLFVDLSGKTVLIVGAGAVALRKLERLLSAGCQIVVLSPACVPAVTDIIASSDQAIWLKRWYSFDYLEEIQPHVAFACTNDEIVNRSIVEHCQRLGIWVNSATHNHFAGDTIVPAVTSLANNALQVAISTQGGVPVLSKYFRQKIEQLFLEQEVEAIITLFTRVRAALKQEMPAQADREAALRSLVSHPLLEVQIHENADSPESLYAWAMSELRLVDLQPTQVQ